MEQSDGRAATGPPPLIGIRHAIESRARRLAEAVAAAGFRPRPLPPLATGARVWRDGGFDLLAFDPFGEGPAPAGLIGLARAIAARRPLLVLSDRDSRADRMLALGAGADDAVGWDADPAEVVARIAGLLRRSRLAAGQIGEGELRIDLIDRRVERAGRMIRMPLREFDLLANLARVPDRPVSRAALLRAVWRIDFDPGTNRVEVHMSRLRARIDRGFAWPMLRTVKGEGYALRSSPDSLA
ncbi:MAG TPA: response regulator transcription factor [Sphingopyxis sp.]|nr:response regulator transcription factor [Sphingopyxis sp.]HMP46016.1 response regulator transcription factor [Sphingopyxis sp.]HMQ18955.1 response regulator transcription factor [Sphingopyxis sp.]